jgi:N-(2-amino-2-carboxyethyl)-L-glutamate synthase
MIAANHIGIEEAHPAPLVEPIIPITRVPPVEGILSAIGNTPLVPLYRLFGNRFHLYGKLEMLNPGGSIKDRAAMRMLLDAWEQRRIGPETTIIESSSGNLGVGLAQACARLGLRFICVVDTLITPTNLAVLKAYGAEVRLVERPHPVTGDLLSARIELVRELCRTIRDSFWVNQYANLTNAKAHHQTMAEIHRELPLLDYLFIATSTCGTLRGCSEYVRKNGLGTRLIAVDACGSVIFGDQPKKRLIPGHGASRRPELYRTGLEDDHINISDIECVRGCFHLLRREAIFAGGSAGAVVAAIARYQDRIPTGATCAAILCDRGERYLDTIFSKEWTQQHFGDASLTMQEADPAWQA